MQEAIAIGLEQSGPKRFFEDQLEAYTERRNVLTSYFDQLGLSYTKPDGSYFLLVDMSPVKIPDGFEVPESCKGRGKDFALCWWLAQELRVVGIPPSEVSRLRLRPRPIGRQPLSIGRQTSRCALDRWAQAMKDQADNQFYSVDHQHIGERFARFAFVRHPSLFSLMQSANDQCKDPELLHAAGKRLLRLKEFIKE
jgi:kynurenine aminotransferase